MEASYETVKEIDKQKSFTILEKHLASPAWAVKLVLGEVSAKKMQQVSLSNNTIHMRISKMSMDVKELVLTEIKPTMLFSFQFDESTVACQHEIH